MTDTMERHLKSHVFSATFEFESGEIDHRLSIWNFVILILHRGLIQTRDNWSWRMSDARDAQRHERMIKINFGRVSAGTVVKRAFKIANESCVRFSGHIVVEAEFHSLVYWLILDGTVLPRPKRTWNQPSKTPRFHFSIWRMDPQSERVTRLRRRISTDDSFPLRRRLLHNPRGRCGFLKHFSARNFNW